MEEYEGKTLCKWAWLRAVPPVTQAGITPVLSSKVTSHELPLFLRPLSILFLNICAQHMENSNNTCPQSQGWFSVLNSKFRGLCMSKCACVTVRKWDFACCFFHQLLETREVPASLRTLSCLSPLSHKTINNDQLTIFSTSAYLALSVLGVGWLAPSPGHRQGWESSLRHSCHRRWQSHRALLPLPFPANWSPAYWDVALGCGRDRALSSAILMGGKKKQKDFLIE